MSEHRSVPSGAAPDEAAALRQTGAAPLHSGDPRRIGPYVPLALLGSGGMGRVYLGRPAGGGSGLVAVKVIRPEYADDAGFRRRFEREASVHDLVRTTRTPRLCGTGFEDRLLWMATEYLPGLDLADAVREDGALASAAVWRLVAELGRALADLAAAGIVHRDLKPSNVLLSVHGAHVIDFGLSKAVDASALTGTGNRVGTPAYMSPEHLRTGTCEPSSDVFSLGATLVYAATGHAPFGDGTGVDVMHRVAFEEPNGELLGEVAAADADLAALLSACLSKEPEGRPAPQELVDAASARAGAADWPEPLAGRVLARQRAYEVLDGLPGDETTRLRSCDAPPVPAPAPAGHAAPSAGGEAEAPESPADPPERLRADEPRTTGRRKPLLVVAAGVVLCATAAGILALDSPLPPGPGTSPGSRTSSGGTLSDGARPSASGSAAYTSASGKSVDGGARTAESSSASAASGSARPGRQGASASPSAPGPSASDDPTGTAPATGTPEGPATPPWISDCTYYAGSGRTREGDSGKRVLQVQCMLTKRGYDVGGSGVDGEFGPGTTAAVESFQSAKGLDADGVVGHDTWTALRETD
ncbi:serine/threonine-protein kinase [Streptomyces sp. SLBN-31]|uniref:serine/threonine-protein kinase n=1 Tax=Streptomyces sp. SLBN-31 TaxID=2768444 RepID=UPI00116671DE|nr:serine/threonine-protein kinase [Streptomyces sp. SLBN-31]TQJ86216.1 serine/threonine protein kinase [Streptomyces sp. SLBN-31]